MLTVCYCLERRVHEAGHFLTVSQKLPLIINLVQFSGRDKNKELTEPAHRVIEEIQKFDAEVIILYLGKKNIELLLQQVIIMSLFLLSLLCFIDVNFMESKFESVSHFVRGLVSTKRHIYGSFKNRFDIGTCYKHFNFTIRPLLLTKVHMAVG